MIRWPVTKSIAAAYTITCRQTDGTPIVFAGSESLAAKYWAGLDGVQLGTLPCAFASVDAAAAGQVDVSVPAAVSADLDFGVYQWLLEYADGSSALARGVFEVEGGPGTDAGGVQPYCTYEEMLEQAAWLPLVADLPTTTPGFLAQRVRARQWFDGLVVANYRGAGIGQFETHSLAAFAFAGVGWRRSQGPAQSILQYLADGRLILRPKVRQICAAQAIAYVGLGQIGVNNQFASHGCYFRDQAEREAVGCTAEIDTNGDGTGEIFVNLSSTDTLFT